MVLHNERKVSHETSGFGLELKDSFYGYLNMTISEIVRYCHGLME